KLIQFHSAHKYLVMCHHIEGYKSLGKLLASNDLEIDELAEKYIEGLMTALMHHANRGSHANTLHHLQGYFKKQLSSAHKQELTNQISSFREGLVPLLVPLTLINHYLMEYPNEYLESQVYLNPHPQELKLRYGY
ncbi:YbgA family protein, partial [Vibrio sp. 10N.222.48.A3]